MRKTNFHMRMEKTIIRTVLVYYYKKNIRQISYGYQTHIWPQHTKPKKQSQHAKPKK